MEISKSRLKELEKIEIKMSALEGAGVDNWEGYDIAMKEIIAQEEIDSKIEKAIEKVLDVLQESAFEPSESGAGFATTEEAQDEAYKILAICLDELRR